MRGRRVLRPWRRQAQLAAQFATRLGVDRRIDRFVGHVLGRLVGVDPFEGSGNLLRGPFPVEQGAHHAPANGVQVQLTRRSGSGSPGTQQCVGGLTGIAPMGPRLRASSRLMVEGERSSVRAMARTLAPSRVMPAMTTRSSDRSCVYERCFSMAAPYSG